jgi:hypothetical protein
MKFDDLRKFYSENFSIGHINGDPRRSSIENKFILVSLICYVVSKSKLKNPDTTYYEIVAKLSQNLGVPDEFIKALAIVCEDFGYDSKSFPTFGLKGNDIIKEIRRILNTYIPF